MHTMCSNRSFFYKCPRLNCQSSFSNEAKVKEHLRIHNNDLDSCQYCPYRYVFSSNYRDHLNKHFRIKDHKCDQCGLAFTSKGILDRHYSKHEGILYCCLICNEYETGRKNTMEMHLRTKHSGLLGKNIHWDAVKQHVKLQ